MQKNIHKKQEVYDESQEGQGTSENINVFVLYVRRHSQL